MGLLDFIKQGESKDVKRKELPEEIRRVVKILKKVKDPETELSIVDKGLVYGLTVKGENVDVFLLMACSTPECRFCQMLAINVQRKVLRDIVTVLKEEGFSKIRVYNELGLLLMEG